MHAGLAQKSTVPLGFPLAFGNGFYYDLCFTAVQVEVP